MGEEQSILPTIMSTNKDNKKSFSEQISSAKASLIIVHNQVVLNPDGSGSYYGGVVKEISDFLSSLEEGQSKLPVEEVVEQYTDNMTPDELQGYIDDMKRKLREKRIEESKKQDDEFYAKHGYYLGVEREGFEYVSLHCSRLSQEMWCVICRDYSDLQIDAYYGCVLDFCYKPRVNPNKLYPGLNAKFWTILKDEKGDLKCVHSDDLPLDYEGLLIFV